MHEATQIYESLDAGIRGNLMQDQYTGWHQSCQMYVEMKDKDS